jgi:uncharacterized SAM-binding protein YcdF (DUF218 family)
VKNIEGITSFIFLEDEPQNADIIFIPGGSWPELAERAAILWNEGYAPFILPSGKYSSKRGFFPGSMTKSDIYNGKYITEWEFLSEVAKKSGVIEEAILCEDSAENTIENAFKSKEVTDIKGLNINRAIICCKAFHARRCLMSYSWAYPETEFFLCPVETQNTNKYNWHTTVEGIERVMGELYRCGNMFKDAIPIWSGVNYE